MVKYYICQGLCNLSDWENGNCPDRDINQGRMFDTVAAVLFGSLTIKSTESFNSGRHPLHGITMLAHLLAGHQVLAINLQAILRKMSNFILNGYGGHNSYVSHLLCTALL